MSNKYWGFFISCSVTVVVAAFAHYYLNHKKNKQTYLKANPVMDVVEALDYRFTDLKYKMVDTKATGAPVVLLAIDDASVQEIGRWPWSRDLMSEILDGLVENGASVVGLDVIFSEPEKAFPENDARLAEVVKKHSSKIVLGTYSNNGLHIRPYQDFCVTEAFLMAGGDQIVKLNTSLSVDDDGDVFDDVPWNQVFPPIFTTVSSDVQAKYLHENKKTSVDELTQFQKNHLKSLKQSAWFGYCAVWLTEDDYLFKENKDKLLEAYGVIFAEKFPELDKNTVAKLEQFKKTIKAHPTPQYGEWVPNILEVQAAADMTGSFVAHLDVDGTVRRYPLFYRSGNRLGTSYVPSLALQMYLVSKGYRSAATVTEARGTRTVSEFLIIDPAKEDGEQAAEKSLVQRLPVDTQGRMLVNYYGPQSTLPYVSAKDMLNGGDMVTVYQRVPNPNGNQILLGKTEVKKKEFFKNRAVLVGATSMGIYDLRNTPVETNYPGPEIHLTMLTNLLDHNYLKFVPQEEITLPLTILILGLMLSLLLAQLGAMKCMLSFGFCMFTGGIVDYMLFSKYQLVYSSLFVVMLIGTVHAVVIVHKYLSEEKKKQALKRTFSKYVSPAVVDEILKAEENLKLGGKKQEMTVFFSDVRGFTKFSERMDPEELVEFLNEYLTPMTELIFSNKGTLDKYMGDGLMAFFGAPIPFPDHAISACKAALQSIDRLHILKEEFKKKNWPDIDIGIGLNTGMMSVGNMGSQIVQSYTVIGDAVNLGARLEGTTKQYGVRILVSEATYNAAKGSFLFREVDRVRVVGKKDPVGAFELLSEIKNTSRKSYMERYHEAYGLYLKRDFAKAMEAFETLEKEEPLDLLVRIYKKRCQEFVAEPPASDWDGVFEMKAK